MIRDILQSRYLRRRVAHKQLARTSLSGGVGVGKSLLTKVFYQAAIKCYNTVAGMNFAIKERS